jgi:CRISPR-associated protein Csx14
MRETWIPIDPMNPGQYFACCGLWELAERQGQRVLTRFAVDPQRPRQGTFSMITDGPLELAGIISALRAGKPSGLAAREKTIAPVLLDWVHGRLQLDWWLDPFWDKASPLKCWAGQQTSEGIVSELLGKLPAKTDEGLLNFAAMTSTRFGVDPRSAWLAADLGYSPNEQGQEAATFPAVELLAAIGLTGFRPANRNQRSYGYSLWTAPLPRVAARLACCEPWDGLNVRTYRFGLGKRGSYKFFRFSEVDEGSKTQW